jgi:hypothetical protein
MPTQQQDYLLRHIETISRLIARLRRKGKPLTPEDTAELNDVLQLTLHLQEKNFGLPAAQFLALPADEQVAALNRAETKTAGHERCLTYATLLKHTAEIYAYRGNSDLALGARLLALHVAVSVALDQPADAASVRGIVRELMGVIDGADLPSPTREMLEQFESGAA